MVATFVLTMAFILFAFSSKSNRVACKSIHHTHKQPNDMKLKTAAANNTHDDGCGPAVSPLATNSLDNL